MNLPSIPTDNLYKFIAVSGLVLMVAGLYFYKSTETDIRAEIFRFQLQQDILTLEANVDSLSNTNKLDSIALYYDKKELLDKIERLPNSYKAYLSLSLIGVGLSIFGFVEWYLKLQVHQNKIVKNEGDKVDKEKSVITHQIRFEREIDLYKETWVPLFELRQHLNEIIRKVESYHTSSKKEREKRSKDVQEHLKHANDSYKIFFDLTHKNAPFYPKLIHDQILAVIEVGAVVLTEAISLEFITEISELSGAKIDSLTKGINKKLVNSIDVLAEMIRARIEISEIK